MGLIHNVHNLNSERNTFERFKQIERLTGRRIGREKGLFDPSKLS